MQANPGPAVVLVSPHLDDAVLSAWSVLTDDGSVDVVNVFDGVPEPGFVTRFDLLTGADESAARLMARREEDREALALAGRRPFGLGFLERQYRDEPPDREAITAALRPAIEGCSQLVLPAGIRAHEDHVAVRDVGLELARGSIPATLYAELPYAIHKGWPHWVTGADPDPHLRPEAEWELDLATVPYPPDSLEPSVRRLDGAEAEAKLAALRAYRTQFPQLNSGAVRRLEMPAIIRYEVYWSVG
jgi:LmbE family N-acetylglucosaminyl deacetylase